MIGRKQRIVTKRTKPKNLNMMLLLMLINWLLSESQPLQKNRGVSCIHIGLAWLLQKVSVTAPIIGATKISHLEDAVGALSIKLT